MWRLRLTTTDTGLRGDLVARVMPDPEVATRETTVQGHLAENGYPTPRIRLASGPTAQLDRSWMLMDLAEGQPLLRDLSGARALLALPRLVKEMPVRLARHAVALHSIDSAELDDEGDQIVQLLRRYQDQCVEVGRHDLARIAGWLIDHHPQGGGRV
ncbi:MAG: hypothetical protein P8N02_00110, partial [Actinomycetota bacterium]|nr:hypothetical protein [Actinomycetota bacterium]